MGCVAAAGADQVNAAEADAAQFIASGDNPEANFTSQGKSGVPFTGEDGAFLPGYNVWVPKPAKAIYLGTER